MKVTINGESRELPASCTVGDLLAPFREDHKAVVLERNGVVERDDTTTLLEGDTLEIVTFVGGG